MNSGDSGQRTGYMELDSLLSKHSRLYLFTFHFSTRYRLAFLCHFADLATVDQFKLLFFLTQY